MVWREGKTGTSELGWVGNWEWGVGSYERMRWRWMVDLHGQATADGEN